MSRMALDPTQPSIDTGVLSPGTEQVGCAVHHSPSSSAEVKNEWS